MKIRRIGWFGVSTDQFDATHDFFGSVLGLRTHHLEPGFAMFALPEADGDYVEVFGAGSTDWPSGDSRTAVSFVVDDLLAAREELSAAGVELVGESQWATSRPGYGWFYFRGPDGHLYAMMQGSHLREMDR
jgi:catechol 2,3-dioxygenase-like lactoylglutathione lyase family enzyme